MLPFNQKVESKPWHTWLLVGVLAVAVVLGFNQWMQKRQAIKSAPIVILLNQETCATSGGAWTGSCQCVKSEQCPFGYDCSDITNGIGVCLDSSSN